LNNILDNPAIYATIIGVIVISVGGFGTMLLKRIKGQKIK
jgi:hypothetical protein